MQWVNSSSSDDALATGFNTTMDSDARIFAADNNATMRDLASSNDVFNNRCGELLGDGVEHAPEEFSATTSSTTAAENSSGACSTPSPRA